MSSQPLLSEASGLSPLRRKTWTTILLLSAAFGSLTLGFTLTGSYLIEMFQSACPLWDSSTAVYAESLVLGCCVITGPLRGYCLQKLGYRLSAVVGFCFLAAGWGLPALAVHLCHYGRATEVLYVLAYGVALSVYFELMYVCIVFCLVLWFPNRLGFSSAFPNAFLALGSLLFGQWFVEMEHLYNSVALSLVSVLLLTGLLSAVLSFLPVFTMRQEPVKGSSLDRRTVTTQQQWTTSEILKDRRFWMIFGARVCLLFPGWGLIGRQKDFLETIWRKPNAPISALSAAAFGAYCSGRFLWMFVSDKVKLKTLWMIGGAVQCLTLILMAVFIYYSGHWGIYAGLVAFLANMVTFSIPKSLSVALLGEVYGSGEIAAHVSGFLSPAFAISGFFGPITADSLYKKTNSYEVFLFLGGGLVVSGLIVLAFVRPPERKF
eukprot:m.116772 g.116772  ORF g.116772 m.116772 type:complete len:433 (+) comp37589_c0_seq2:108-1406(+)